MGQLSQTRFLAVIVSSLLFSQTCLSGNTWIERITLEPGALDVVRGDMNETHGYHPVTRLLGENPDEGDWYRKWNETAVYAALAYTVVDKEGLTFRPGFSVGVSEGKFRAYDTPPLTDESWRTGPAFRWGAELHLEAYPESSRRLVLLAEYAFAEAAAAEESESFSSPDIRITEAYREAHFKWTTQQARFGAGWTWGALTPVAGVQYDDFTLKKDLTFGIPDADGDPIATAVNEEGAQYRYESGSPWSAFLMLTWDINPRSQLRLFGNLFGDQTLWMNLSVRL